MHFERYNLTWQDGTDDASIERYMLQNGGQWQHKGRTVGEGLIHHFQSYWKALWPSDSQNRWTDLILHEVLNGQFTTVAGGASSWKSGTVARIALMDWSLFPECTTVLVSSTTMTELKNRIFGEMIKMWKDAKEQYDWFPGYSVDSKTVITNENVEEELARDIRNSIVGVACKTASGKFQGMSSFVGKKNRRVWCVSDEVQFMERSFLDAQNNLISNGPNLVPGIIRDPQSIEYGKPIRGYKAVFIGNPNPTRPDNPLHLLSEPKNGWASIPDDGKTKVWDCRKLQDHPVQCRCINLDANDSPNNDFPGDTPKWVHLVGKHTLAKYTEGSESYYSQGRGIFKFGLAAFKIITKEVCDQFHAFDPVVWSNKPTTKIGMLDAAYGGVGGDRCPLGYLEFGECIDGKERILFHPFWPVPVTVRADITPEDQIAIYTKDKMEANGIPPENFFFDGRGSLAMALARVWSPRVNSVEFGGRPTDRVVDGEFVQDGSGQGKRPKLAFEHYSKFVSELWWSWRYAIEADQIRGLTLETVLDASPREWRKVAGDKKEIETKKDMKKRTGISPDLADCAVTGLEGARRRGFNISKLANQGAVESNRDWWFEMQRKQQNMRRGHVLNHAA